LSSTYGGSFRIADGVVSRGSGSGFNFPGSTGTPRRWCAFAEIARNETAGKMGSCALSTFSGFNKDYSRAIFLDGLENPAVVLVDSSGSQMSLDGIQHSKGYANIADLVSDEAAQGPINSVNVGFNKSGYPLRIFMIGVARLS
jgi:hypothetical protein